MRVRVASAGWNDSFLLDARDLSSGGVFLRSDLLFPLGQEIELEFAPRGRAARTIRRMGRVVRVAGRTLRSDPGFVVGNFGLTESERSLLQGGTDRAGAGTFVG